MDPVSQALYFLISTLFDLYTFILILRFILQYLGINYYNPFTQFVVKATSPVVKPFRRIIPGYKGIDFATLTVILILSLIKLALIWFITYKSLPFIPGLLLLVVGDIIKLTINLYFYAILAQVILSWVAPTSHSPVVEIINRLTWPIMRPFKRWIPPIGGIDISPIPAMISLQLVKILIANSLLGIGTAVALMS